MVVVFWHSRVKIRVRQREREKRSITQECTETILLSARLLSSYIGKHLSPGSVEA